MQTAGIEGKTPDQELLALCKTPEATPEAIETLLKAGADVNARDEDGDTALMRAAWQNSNLSNIEYIYQLDIPFLESGNVRKVIGITALMEAARHNSNPAIIETLLEAGANVKAKDKKGKAEIDYARENEKIYKTKANWKLNDALYE